MNKQLSCGIIFKDVKNNILIVRPTNSKYYNIPKGLFDPEIDYSYWRTVVREIFEETGIEIKKLNIYDLDVLGLIPYLKYKDLFLFEITLDELPNINSLYCDSTFINMKTGQEQPEVDDYKIIKLNEYPRWLNKNMVKVFNKIYHS